MRTNNAILLISCPDKQGIVAKVTEFIYRNKGNIIYLDQHVDQEEKVFFMRAEWEMEKFLIPEDKLAEQFQAQIAPIYDMKFDLYFTKDTLRMAIFVSTMPHCLFDMLSRYMDGEWQVEIPLIISNHPDLEPVAKRFGIPFHYIPVTADTKTEAEKQQLKLLQENNVDLIVLARYMQIISSDFVNKYSNRIINIHHSFLPAFPGSKPYHSAYKRGVKIIGATSHYITADLDEGPIIEQDVTRISHKDTVEALIRKGQDLEKIVLSRAVFMHSQHRTLVCNNKTIVFS